MAISQKEEARALNDGERELVEKSHHPAVQDLSDQELLDLAKLLRGAREKARTQAFQRRREMRGKAAPRGAEASRSDSGSHLKVEVLAMAMRRLNSEIERRRRLAAAATLVENARKALDMKQASQSTALPNSRHAHQGMRNVASGRREDLARPMELGRQRKAASVSQAKRDSR
jgi:hypothetical protein